MNRRIADIANLLELIENGTITVSSVQCKTKASADITETDNIIPTDYIESLEYLNKSKLFKDSVDFHYEFAGENSIRIECGIKNLYLDEYFYADCVIKDSIPIEDIKIKLRETIFHKMNEKVAV